MFRFGAVCKNWQSIAKLNHQTHQFKTNILPMLVIPWETFFLTQIYAYSDKKKKTWWLYSIPNKRSYPFLQFNQSCLKLRLCGSSHGWLALVDDSTSITTLMNPFIKDIPHIILPPLNLVYKVTLSADPIKCPNDYMVAAIYDSTVCCGDGNLAFMRSGQTFWTYLDTSKSGFCDVIFYKGLLFALNVFRRIVSFNFGCSNDHLDRKAITSYDGECCFQGKYFVKSLKEELWIVRGCNKRKGVFRVFKLQLDAKNEKVEQMFELKCLEDNILFLGEGDSISVSASYFSKSLQRDSIYFANYLKIYDMKSESISYHCLEYSDWTTNFWVLPHFEWNCVRRLPHGIGTIRDEKMERGQQSKGVRKGIRKRFPSIKLRDFQC
jgi:hypothetical protein